MTSCSWVVALLSAVSVCAAGQSMRDPTVPPGAALAAQEGSPVSAKAAGSGLASQSDSGGGGSTAFTIIVRNGKPSVVVGTRLYMQGQKLGVETIERITETEVWLRRGRVVRKVPQFSGIERRAVTVQPCQSPPNLPRVASCADDQP